MVLKTPAKPTVPNMLWDVAGSARLTPLKIHTAHAPKTRRRPKRLNTDMYLAGTIFIRNANGTTARITLCTGMLKACPKDVPTKTKKKTSMKKHSPQQKATSKGATRSPKASTAMSP
mmetsp:Transcript_13912/g.25796  ORF Transcript_13912/g.25796 Transcript_13912/m.25796 type:complete len:117 (+) Transcript_13912:70-420(+)